MEKTLETHLFTRLPSDFLVVVLFSHLTNPIQNHVKKSEIDHFQVPFKHSQTNKNTKILSIFPKTFIFFLIYLLKILTYPQPTYISHVFCKFFRQCPIKNLRKNLENETKTADICSVNGSVPSHTKGMALKDKRSLHDATQALQSRRTKLVPSGIQWAWHDFVAGILSKREQHQQNALPIGETDEPTKALSPVCIANRRARERATKFQNSF